MHVISRKKLKEAAAAHGNLAEPLDAWYRTARSATWANIFDLRRQFPTADVVGKYTVFNIKGNTYRLVVQIYYISQVILVREVLTHADYDKEGWKK